MGIRALRKDSRRALSPCRHRGVQEGMARQKVLLGPPVSLCRDLGLAASRVVRSPCVLPAGHLGRGGFLTAACGDRVSRRFYSQGVWALLACGTRDAFFLSAPPGFPGPLQSHSCEAGSVLKEKSEWPLEGTQLVLNKWDSTGL